MSNFGFDADFDELTRSLKELKVVDNPSIWWVGTGVEYSVYLEFGTRHMDPRPFFRPALLEARMDPERFIEQNTRTHLEDIDGVEELVRTLAFALERRIKEIIATKGLIDTGTLRASVMAVPGSPADLPTEGDIDLDDDDNAIDPRAQSDFEVSA